MFTEFDNKIDRLEWHTTFACCAIRALEKFLYEKDIMTAEDSQRLREQISDDVRKEMHKH